MVIETPQRRQKHIIGIVGVTPVSAVGITGGIAML